MKIYFADLYVAKIYTTLPGIAPVKFARSAEAPASARKFLRRLRNDYVLSAGLHRFAVADFTLFCPRLRSLSCR